MSPSEDPTAYQLGPETVKTVSGHVGEDTGAYGEHEVHKAGLGISMSEAFCVSCDDHALFTFNKLTMN